MKHLLILEDSYSELKYELTPQGYLRCEAVAGKVGIQRYQRPDGTCLRMLRDPKHLFDEASLKTLAGIPVTDGHPPVKLLNPENTKEYARGFTANDVKVDGAKIKITATITDAELIRDVKDGKRQVSPGYLSVIDYTPGKYQGEDYDCVQTQITYNHFAVLDEGRAGPEVSLLLDADDLPLSIVGTTQTEESPVKEKITIGGVTVEVSAEDKTKIQAHLDGQTALLDSAKAEVETVKTQASTLQGKLETATDKLAKAKTTVLDGADVRKLVKERAKLERVARVVLDAKDHAEIETLEDLDLKKKVILADNPSAKLTSEEAAYLDGRYQGIADACTEDDQAALEVGKPTLEVKAGEKSSAVLEDGSDSAKARAKMIADQKEQATKPFSTHV